MEKEKEKKVSDREKEKNEYGKMWLSFLVVFPYYFYISKLNYTA